MMHIRAAIVGCLALVTWSSCAQAQFLTFHGICDASAAIAIDDRTIIVGDDEKPWLSVYDILTQQLKEPPIALAVSQHGANAAGQLEADIEAATVFKGRIVWISSHGRNKHGEVVQERYQLFASHGIDRHAGAARINFSNSFHELLPMVLARGGHAYEPLVEAIGDLSTTKKSLAPKKDGFNIEGLTATADDSALLVGMRNPRARSRAILFQLNGFDSYLAGAASQMLLGEVTHVDLDDRGIRDIAWSPAHQRYLIIAGQADDEKPGHGFALYKWGGPGDNKPDRSHAFGDFERDLNSFHPEAVVPLLEKSAGGFVHSRRVLILSDDGERKLEQDGFRLSR